MKNFKGCKIDFHSLISRMDERFTVWHSNLIQAMIARAFTTCMKFQSEEWQFPIYYFASKSTKPILRSFLCCVQDCFKVLRNETEGPPPTSRHLQSPLRGHPSRYRTITRLEQVIVFNPTLAASIVHIVQMSPQHRLHLTHSWEQNK